MMDKIAVLSLLVASLSFGASATEIDTEAQEEPAVEIENSGEPMGQDMSLAEPKDRVENLTVQPEEKCKDTEKDCDEEKMAEDENPLDDNIMSEQKSNASENENSVSITND